MIDGGCSLHDCAPLRARATIQQDSDKAPGEFTIRVGLKIKVVL